MQSLLTNKHRSSYSYLFCVDFQCSVIIDVDFVMIYMKGEVNSSSR